MKVVDEPDLDRWEEYRDLRIMALREAPQAFLDDVETSLTWPKEEWQRRMKAMFFAEVEGKWVGMIGGYLEDKEKTKHILNVVSFYVEPEYRGKGVGRGLVDAVITKARTLSGVRKLQLGVITTQEAAYKLYLSRGFVKAGELHGMVRVGNDYYDEYLMEYVF